MNQSLSERAYWMKAFADLDTELRQIMQPFNNVRTRIYSTAMPTYIVDTETGVVDYKYAFPETTLKLLEQVADMEKSLIAHYTPRFKELYERVQRSQEC